MSSETTVMSATKKLFKWLAAALVTLGLVASLIALGTYLFYEIKDRPKVEIELKGIAIGEKFSEVMFKHSGFKVNTPPKNLNGSESSPDEKDYSNTNERLHVSFKNNLVDSVRYACSKEYEYTSVSTISCNDSSEKIKKRFGENIQTLCFMDDEFKNQLRVYDAIEYGIRYQLFYNKVVGFVIFKPEELKKQEGINWSKCD